MLKNENNYYKFFVLIFILLFSFNVKANTISKIDMDIY